MDARIEAHWRDVKALGDALDAKAERSVDASAESKVPLLYFKKERYTASALMLLLKERYIQDAKILFRSQFENMIYLMASIEDIDAFRELFRGEFAKQQQKSINSLIKSQELSNKEISQRNLDRQAELEKAYTELKGKNLDVYKLATDLGFEKECRLFYGAGYHEVHSTPMAVMKHFNTTTKEFIHDPELDFLESVACGSLWFYLISIESLMNFFKLDEFRDRLIKLNDRRKILENELLGNPV